jgi:hypothetical protein
MFTNPGLPPPLSKAHHEEAAEHARHLRADIDAFAEMLDQTLESVSVPITGSRSMRTKAVASAR